MILTALKELSDREGLIISPALEFKPLAYMIEIDQSGHCLNIRDTFVEVPVSKGKPKRKPRTLAVPRPFPGARRSGTIIDSGFLVDNASFVLGANLSFASLKSMSDELQEGLKGIPGVSYDALSKKLLFRGLLTDSEGSKLKALSDDTAWQKAIAKILKENKHDSEELDRRRESFGTLIRDAENQTSDPALKAVSLFLDDLTLENFPQIPHDATSNALFGFVYEPDVDVWLHRRPIVQKYWENYRAKMEYETGDFTCLITGQSCKPIDKHPQIKVPGGTPSGVALVSYRACAFESYGLKLNENAPVSRPAAEAYTTALNRLLAWSYPSPEDGSPLPMRNIKFSDNTVLLYWSREESEFTDCFSDAVEAEPEAVEALYNSTWKGRPVNLDDPSAFYALTLSGATGRATIRGWFESTVRDVAGNIRQHFEDLEIVRYSKMEKSPFALKRLLFTTAAKAKRGEDPYKKIHPNLASEMFGSIVKGYAYPRIVLDAAIRRIRAEQNIPPSRAALIKAYLVRARRLGKLNENFPEVKEMLDKNCEIPAYRLGRLFSVLDKLQQDAVRSKTTIRGRYYGAASTTPNVVFGQLINKSGHNLAKLKKSHQVFYENWIQEVMWSLEPSKNPFPPTLSLEEQGLFALGYYHQRQALFTKSADKKEETENE